MDLYCELQKGKNMTIRPCFHLIGLPHDAFKNASTEFSDGAKPETKMWHFSNIQKERVLFTCQQGIQSENVIHSSKLKKLTAALA
jgi:hypothetical protein